MFIREDGHGVFEENDLTDNVLGPWDIHKDCEKNVKRARNRE